MITLRLKRCYWSCSECFNYSKRRRKSDNESIPKRDITIADESAVPHLFQSWSVSAWGAHWKMFVAWSLLCCHLSTWNEKNKRNFQGKQFLVCGILCRINGGLDWATTIQHFRGFSGRMIYQGMQ